jgi:Tat protein translocase TatB subunit
MRPSGRAFHGIAASAVPPSGGLLAASKGGYDEQAMDLGLSEILFIFVLALLLFGPKKLPEIGRQVGKFLAEFKRAKNEFQSQLQDEMRQLEIDAAAKQAPKVAPPAPPPPGSIASGVLGQPHLEDNALPATSTVSKAPDA